MFIRVYFRAVALGVHSPQKPTHIPNIPKPSTMAVFLALRSAFGYKPSQQQPQPASKTQLGFLRSARRCEVRGARPWLAVSFAGAGPWLAVSFAWQDPAFWLGPPACERRQPEARVPRAEACQAASRLLQVHELRAMPGPTLSPQAFLHQCLVGQVLPPSSPRLWLNCFPPPPPPPLPSACRDCHSCRHHHCRCQRSPAPIASQSRPHISSASSSQRSPSQE